MGQEKYQETGLQVSVAVPEKHFPKWLEKQSHIAELKLWIGFAEFVLTLGTFAGLIIYVANRPPETLKDLAPIFIAICSLFGALASLHRYINRKQHNE